MFHFKDAINIIITVVMPSMDTTIAINTLIRNSTIPMSSRLQH